MVQQTQPFFQVDAFTDRAFSGNPAAVMVLGVEASADWMQSVATEMNLSETAFVVPRQGGPWGLRWFTPAVEVPLCGHATLAAAHVIFDGDGERSELRFDTHSGVLSVRRVADGYAMDFPALRPEPWPLPEATRAALGEAGLDRTVAVEASFHHETDWYALIELADAESVRRVEPDFRALGVEPGGGWIVTARADAKAKRDFGDDVEVVSRFFAPALGVDEDPVTGSAHCVLAPFWTRRLVQDAVVAAQISPRGGVVRCRVDGDRVELRGQAVTVARGELLVGRR
ncbi:MAG: PhzF family phenazine biosynthesis protein [Acidobacteriota bacterium]